MLAPGARKYIPCWRKQAWLCSRFCDVPFFRVTPGEFGRNRKGRKEREEGGFPLLADLHLVFPLSIKFRSSALTLDIVRGEDSDNYWKLEAVILFTGSQNYDRRKVNAGVRKQREHRGGKSRARRNEGKLGLREDKNTFRLLRRRRRKGAVRFATLLRGLVEFPTY